MYSANISEIQALLADYDRAQGQIDELERQIDGAKQTMQRNPPRDAATLLTTTSELAASLQEARWRRDRLSEQVLAWVSQPNKNETAFANLRALIG